MGTKKDIEKYNSKRMYEVRLLRTNKNGGYFDTLKEALKAKEKFGEYATIIRVNPTTRSPMYDSTGWPMPLQEGT